MGGVTNFVGKMFGAKNPDPFGDGGVVKNLAMAEVDKIKGAEPPESRNVGSSLEQKSEGRASNMLLRDSEDDYRVARKRLLGS